MLFNEERLNNDMNSYCNTNTQVITNKPLQIHKSKGLLGMLMIIILMEIFSKIFNQIPNTSGLFILAVIYCIYKDGVLYGSISAILAIFYTLYFYSIPNEIFHYTKIDLLSITFNAISLIGGILIVGFQRNQISSYCRDLSERKDTYLTLLESEERYRQLVDYSPDAIAVHYNGKIIYANNSVAKLMKLSSPVLLIGKDIESYLYFQSKDSIMSKIKEIESGLTEATQLITEKIIAQDGSLIDVEIVNIAFPYKGELAVQVIIRDISDRKKAEILEESIEEKKKQLEIAVRTDQVKTELFSNISHELKTPINVIFATLQLMELFIKTQYDNNDQKTINKYLHITKQNSYRLLRLVNNSIDISKIDSGYFQLNLQNHDIVSLVEDIALSVAEYIENKSIQLQFDTNIEELVIACDPDKIERIVLNLLSNATKFTKKNGYIYVTLKKYKDSVFISVRDTGIGIPKDQLHSVFQRYKQVSRSLIKNNQGSGIGLSLVKSLVEMHSGKITVRSELDKGSEFIIELPTKKLSTETLPESLTDINESRIERITIEFSDIYA